MLLEEYDGSKEPKCAQLLRKERSGGARGGADYYCDLGAKSRKGASLNKGLPWLPYSSELWVVTTSRGIGDRRRSPLEGGLVLSSISGRPSVRSEQRRL